jgi:hypothetical protein
VQRNIIDSVVLRASLSKLSAHVAHSFLLVKDIRSLLHGKVVDMHSFHYWKVISLKGCRMLEDNITVFPFYFQYAIRPNHRRYLIFCSIETYPILCVKKKKKN